MRKLIVLAVLVSLVGIVRAEEPKINPVLVTTPRIVLYGTNPLKIGGTEVTASAAELNIMDGVTVTASQLNAAGNGSTATLTSTLVSNAASKVYCSNLVVKTGGTVTVPAGSIAAASLAAPLYTGSIDVLIPNGTYGTTSTIYFASGICTNIIAK